VIVGSIVRVGLLPGPQAADAIIAAVLIPLGTDLMVRRTAANPSGVAALVPLVPIAAVVGCVGGIHGIGGGAILAPILIGAGRSPVDVAPATLASTLATSVAGVALSSSSRPFAAGRWPRTGASVPRSASEG